MKKVLLLAAVALGAMSANAQGMAIEQPKLYQNWSIGIDGGATTPLYHGSNILKNARGMVGLSIKKQVTPIFGLGFESSIGFNTSSWKPFLAKYNDKSTTVVDNQYVGVFGTVDLFNLFGGYKCAPRFFTIETVVGAGWGHYYRNDGAGYRPDVNFFETKFGLNFNFNVCKNLTVALKPSISYDMNGHAAKSTTNQSPTAFDVNYAAFNLEAGLSYAIGGTHFNCVQPMNQAEIDALNAQINDLRAALEACIANNAVLEAKAADLAAQLAACLNRKPEVQIKEVVKKVDNNTLTSVRYVFFKIGSSVITADQMPNVEMIASYLKNHKGAKVVVKGYASQDGPLDVNIRLAQNRAESVKKALISKYGIKADRIVAEGEGIGKMFKEESWNRVSICMIEDAE